MALIGDLGGVSMEVRVNLQPDKVVLQPIGAINSVTAESFGNVLMAAIEQNQVPIELDLAEVPYASSAAFRVLLIAIQKLDQRRQRLRLSKVPHLVSKALDTANFTSLVDVVG